MIKFTRKDALYLTVLYTGLCSVLYFMQDRLLFFPETADSIPSGWKAIYSPDRHFLGIENNVKSEKTLVIFHGNSGNVNKRIFYKRIFPDTHIVLSEYPGYGLNFQEKISTQSLVERSRETMDYVTTQYARHNIVVLGESLGTGIAAQMSKEYQIPKNILITPYSSLKEVAQNKFWFVPSYYLLKTNFNSITNLKEYQGESLVIVSENDDVIPPRFAYKLYASLKGKKELLLAHNAAHNNWFNYLNQEQFAHIRKFIQY